MALSLAECFILLPQVARNRISQPGIDLESCTRRGAHRFRPHLFLIAEVDLVRTIELQRAPLTLDPQHERESPPGTERARPLEKRF